MQKKLTVVSSNAIWFGEENNSSNDQFVWPTNIDENLSLLKTVMDKPCFFNALNLFLWPMISFDKLNSKLQSHSGSEDFLIVSVLCLMPPNLTLTNGFGIFDFLWI